MQLLLDLLDRLLEAGLLIRHRHFLELADVLGLDLGQLSLELLIEDDTLVKANN